MLKLNKADPVQEILDIVDADSQSSTDYEQCSLNELLAAVEGSQQQLGTETQHTSCFSVDVPSSINQLDALVKSLERKYISAWEKYIENPKDAKLRDNRVRAARELCAYAIPLEEKRAVLEIGETLGMKSVDTLKLAVLAVEHLNRPHTCRHSFDGCDNSRERHSTMYDESLSRGKK